MDYKHIIKKLENEALHPSETIAASAKATGKEPFGCFPIYTPEEIVYAAGYLPVGMWGGKTELQLADKYLQSFCCSIMRANLEYGLKGTYDRLKGIVLPTFCDTLKCMCENWKVAVPHIPILPVVYPQNRNLAPGLTYMVEEFERFQKELEHLSGRKIKPEKLEDAYRLYEEYREVMRTFTDIAVKHPEIIGPRRRHLIIKAGYFCDKKDYIENIKSINAGLKQEETVPFKGKKVIATGLLAEPDALLQLFEENNIAFAGDDLAQESRQFRVEGRDGESVFKKMAYRITDQKGCTFLYEAQKTRGQMLIDLVRSKKADGVVVFMMKFCDPEEFDYPVYKKELEAAQIPVLYLEVDQQLDSFEQMRTRIQSFAEMLV